MSRESAPTDIKAHAQSLLTEMFKVDSESLTAESRLNEDLDLDSIDTIDLLSRINDDFAMDLSPFDFEGCATLGQFLTRLEECREAQLQKTPAS